MAQITGELDLSGISKNDFNKDLGLRVAVVRDGKVLGSTDLKPPADTAKRVSFGVEFNPVFNPGIVTPCGVIVVVGPQLPDRELLAVDTLKYTVNFSPAADSAQKNLPAKSPAVTESAQKERAAVIAVNVGTLVVDPAIYLCWIYCCSTYNVRGRLICREWSYNPTTKRYSFCDNPVPGATVSIYNVYCFLWWCWRSLIGTATTDINGNFTFTFRWCCFRWLPWLDPNWIVDESLYRRISELLTLAKIPVPPIPGPGPDPAIFQSFLTNARGSRRSSRRALTDNTSSAAVSPSSLSREALLSVLPASAELEALHIWPWWPWYDCGPNIIFEATQLCRDRREVVYSETNGQARWDIGTNTSVTLVASDRACCLPTCHEPPCPDCLAFSWICSIPSDQISADTTVPALLGYAETASVTDLAFTLDLQIRGDLGAGIDYYKVQYSYNGGAWTDLPVPAFEGFPISYWGPSSPPYVPVPGGFNPVLKNGQTVIISRDHYAALNGTPTVGGQVDWNDFDTLFYFNTLASVISDGLYELRLVGYTADAGDNLTNERVVPLCGHDVAATMFVRVDNQHSVHPPPTPTHPFGPNPPICSSTYSSNHICTLEPECFFRQICKNEGTPEMQCIAACDIVHLSLKEDDTLTIHFTVSCPNNSNDANLAGYTLEAIYGYSDVLTIGTATSTACPSSVSDPVGTFVADPPTPGVQVGPTYALALAQGATRPLWYGGDYKVTLRACDFPESCAYDLQLCAWKRTTNGCTVSGCLNLDYNIFDLTLTIAIDP